ncbi:hypothetical protein XELAEV_18039418mg [Xenopus laevis]|uniref:Uncharacterized protein n=1 Tax=Xenopus laevis TaxID=8355 RepID=A0A974C7R2_XENLA|nr:hypothetical protein XELAEV_18039418mg [Xenopus laevis]
MWKSTSWVVTLFFVKGPMADLQQEQNQARPSNLHPCLLHYSILGGGKKLLVCLIHILNMNDCALHWFKYLPPNLVEFRINKLSPQC